jgi:hypothetical protein
MLDDRCGLKVEKWEGWKVERLEGGQVGKW